MIDSLGDKTKIPIAAEGEKNKDREYGLCVVETIESMLSEVAQEEMRVSASQRELRLFQMKKAEELIVRRENRLGLQPANLVLTHLRREHMKRVIDPALRMDLMALENYVNQLRQTPDKIGDLLQDCTIHFVRGDVNEFLTYFRNGYSVGVMAMFDNPKDGSRFMHMFHLGIDGNHNYYDKSDSGETKQVVDNEIKSMRLQSSMGMITAGIRGKNVLLLRKKI